MKTLEEIKAELLEEARISIIDKLETKLFKFLTPFFYALIFLFIIGSILSCIFYNFVYIVVPLSILIPYVCLALLYDRIRPFLFKKRISDQALNIEYKELMVKKKTSIPERRADILEELVELQKDYESDLQELKNTHEKNCEELKKEFGDLLEDYETICKLNETI